MNNPLSVIIPCKDEAHNIRACVDSARPIADEIIVADSGSTDGTLEIAHTLEGCRVVEREFVGYSNFKNWAIAEAAHPWVFLLDADERITGPLAEEIRRILAGTPDCDAYAVRLHNYLLGRPINHCGWNTSKATRLLRREVCRYDQRRVHEGVEVDSGKVGILRGRLLHHTCPSLERYLGKMNRYTTLTAEDRYEAGRRTNFLRLLLRPPLRFLQSYILRAGFLDGTAGLVVCLNGAFYTFLKEAKLWEHGLRDDPRRATDSQPQARRAAA